MGKVNHDLRSQNGRTIYMPSFFAGEVGWGNLAVPNVYTADAVRKYPVGTRFVDGERVFKYVKYDGQVLASTYNVVANTDGDDLLGKGLFGTAFAQDYASSVIKGVAGSNEIEVWDTVAATNAGTERADNFYSGGYINGKDTAPADARMFFRYIEESKYVATKTIDGTSRSNVTTLTVDQPVIATFTALTFVLLPNVYKHAAWMQGASAQGFSPCLGLSMCNNPTYDYYVWVQTWGPCGTAHITNAARGAAAQETKVYVFADGSLQFLDGATESYDTTSYQLAGYTLPNTIFESGSGQDEDYPIIFLTISQ